MNGDDSDVVETARATMRVAIDLVVNHGGSFCVFVCGVRVSKESGREEGKSF